MAYNHIFPDLASAMDYDSERMGQENRSRQPNPNIATERVHEGSRHKGHPVGRQKNKKPCSSAVTDPRILWMAAHRWAKIACAE